MNRNQQLALIDKAFDAIPDLQDGFHSVRERLYDMDVTSERRHRNGRTGDGLSVPKAAKLFTVKHLLDGFKEPNRFTVDDITSIRNEVLYAQAYAKRFHAELTEWASKYAQAFEQVDYAFLMKQLVKS